MLKAPTPPAELFKKIAHATRPPRLPRGYFDELVKPARMLLDRGFKLHHVADFLIGEDCLPKRMRGAFMIAMHSRIFRLTRKKLTAGVAAVWSSSLFYDAPHLVQPNERKALCGASATVWEAARKESNRCSRCTGIARKHGMNDSSSRFEY